MSGPAGKGLSIVLAVLVTGAVFYKLRHDRQAAMNRAAIDRMISGDRMRPGSNAVRPRPGSSTVVERHRAAKQSQ